MAAVAAVEVALVLVLQITLMVVLVFNSLQFSETIVNRQQ
jgi:hypothetical protein